MKTCPKCNERAVMDRDLRWCRECRNKYHAGWYWKHREEQVRRMAQSREANPERQRGWQKGYDERHPGRRAEQCRHNWARHCEEYRRKSRQKYWGNPEAARKYAVEWRRKNLEKCLERERRDYWNHREARIVSMKLRKKQRFFYERARKFNERYGHNGDPVTPLQLWGLYKRQGGTCALTGRQLEPRTRKGVALDHIVPRVVGGKTEIRNLRWLCYEANVAKATMRDDQFKKLCLDVLAHEEMPLTKEDYKIPEWARRLRECGVGI